MENVQNNEKFLKPVISFRFPASEKQKLSDESLQRGLKLSEYCEQLLLNRSGNNLKQEENDKLRIENSQMRQQLNQIQAQQQILKDKRLDELFEALKGQSDTVVTPEGQSFSIVYDTPEKLLLAMIYSFSLNN